MRIGLATGEIYATIVSVAPVDFKNVILAHVGVDKQSENRFLWRAKVYATANFAGNDGLTRGKVKFAEPTDVAMHLLN